MNKNLCLLLLLLITIHTEAQTPEQKYETYVQEKLCENETDTNCLKATSYIATRGDGRRVKVRGVFEWVGEDPNNHLFKPHFLMGYMKLLRNAYYSSPSYASQLYNQIDFLVSKAFDRNGALVWENPEGIAQGMEQVEFGNFFITAADAFKYNKDTRSAKGIMNYALKFIRAVDMQAGIHTGGVSSVTTYCGSKKARARPCYWFHSRGIAITDAPGVRTVLNQHLHVITDLLSAYLNVLPSPELIDPQFGTPQQLLNFLEDKAIGGLYQLVFSEGHKGVAPYRPPNIKQFMQYKRVGIRPTPEHPDGNPLSYYRAFYEFDMTTGKGLNIKSSCHYHTHVLNLVAGIKTLVDDGASVFKSTENGWRLYEALDALLKGRGEPTGMTGSSSAIYQFYRSEAPAYKLRREKCNPKGETLTPKALAIYSAHFDSAQPIVNAQISYRAGLLKKFFPEYLVVNTVFNR